MSKRCTLRIIQMENTGNIAKSIASNAEASATVTDRPVAFTVVDAG